MKIIFKNIVKFKKNSLYSISHIKYNNNFFVMDLGNIIKNTVRLKL